MVTLKWQAVPTFASLLLGGAAADDDRWQEEDYPRICIFPEVGLEEPEPCRSFVRASDRRADDGDLYTIYEYKWRGTDGREVVYRPEIGGFGGRFSIGTLDDNRYDGGRTFKPAISHTSHRDKTVIGSPGELYLFSVCDEKIDGKTYCE